MFKDKREAGIKTSDDIRGLLLDIHSSTISLDSIEKATQGIAEVRKVLHGSRRPRWYELFENNLSALEEENIRIEARDHSLFRGELNPLSIPIKVRTEIGVGDEEVIIGEVRIDRCREGPQGRVHGGYLAGLFDDVLSGAVRLAGGGPAVTGRLKVRYKRATPIDKELRFEARLESSLGRRIIAKAVCLADGEVTAEAEALFVKLSNLEK